MVLWNVVLIIRRDNINNSVCVCLSGSPSGSWPTLQVHHPRIAGPHQGGVSVSPGTVPQVDNTQTRTHDIHKEESPDVLDSPRLQFCLCHLPSNTKTSSQPQLP